MGSPAPSPTRRTFEALVRAREFKGAAVVYNGLAMYEMLPAYAALDGGARTDFQMGAASLGLAVFQERMTYAFQVVEGGQMPPGEPPGDLRATGQEEDAREFLAPVPAGLAGFLFANLLALYPQGPPEEAKTLIGGKVDAAWIENTCAVRISRVLDYSGLPVPRGGKDLATVSGADSNFYSYRQKELQAWFGKKVGLPSLSLGARPDRRKLSNLQGFLGFDIHFNDATGHFDLWDGVKFQLEPQATHDYFAMAKQVVFWRVPSWRRA